MTKAYQKDYAANRPQMYDTKSREEKAVRIVKTLAEFFGRDQLKKLTLLDVGASSGIIDNYLSKHFKSVIGIDIDENAIKFASKTYKRKNLHFKVDDAMKLSFKNEEFDVVICTHVYEHVPSPQKLFDEIYRVTKPGGVCYLAAINSLWPLEPHYNLLFLSYLPKNLANLYIRFFGKAEKYYETPVSYWKMKKLTKKFKHYDYTPKILSNPKKFGYTSPSIPQPFSSLLTYFTPTMFFLLEK